ncbi:PREDICTED: uncharacterized protein LOC108567324 [Nicrophorus vespilloides]|uniref:Uncharacterized protein LOC108567324 n=1 Tax=Nicrophorus vespilloides TaxID=110193 RepID=A0ABM1N8Q2_NICVS|nr:PREDICTED: uncharacterized protein LOC108567324 [Nicrophorus vespilloides]
MKHINSSLISLKCVLFLFFGGMGCLFPFLPLHMTLKGLSVEEAKIISIVAPCIALIGPAIAAPLADKLAGGPEGNKRSKTGRYLRVMIAVCFILAAIFYWLLAAVPTIVRSPPSVTFTCDPNGGTIFQERCGVEKTCYNWNSDNRGSLFVTNCRFTCESSMELTSDVTTIYPDQDTSVASDEYDENDYNENDIIVEDDESSAKSQTTDEVVPHPHLCYTDANGFVVCEVFTKYSKPIDLNVNLFPSKTGNAEEDEDTICTYPIGSDFHCRIAPEVESNLTKSTNSCHPIVKCNVYEPYRSKNMLKVSECGYNNISFWLYLFIRSFADIFPATAVALLAAAIIIATRETSTGRGDVGKQLACGALGFAILAPIIGAINHPIVSLIIFSVLMVLAALIILFDSKMPLSPPEWWWHTQCGLLAYPMSSVRKYGFEIAGLAVVLTMLGVFWSAMDSYLPWRVADLSGSPLLVGLTITAGALPAVPFLIFAEKIVDYCGHTNLLITAFTFYIIHYTSLAVIENAWLLLICEAFEIFSLHLMWTTAILYLRHLVPRRFTVCGQALPIITHFCIGRFIGALIGGIAYSESHEQFMQVHKWFAVAAAIIATIYFLSYHFYLKPKCAAPLAQPPRPAPATVNGANTNGSYTPLRVYHNGRAKKGQFRY